MGPLLLFLVFLDIGQDIVVLIRFKFEFFKAGRRFLIVFREMLSIPDDCVGFISLIYFVKSPIDTFLIKKNLVFFCSSLFFVICYWVSCGFWNFPMYFAFLAMCAKLKACTIPLGSIMVCPFI